MDRLSSMPNIGQTLEKKLVSAGISAPEDLVNTGSREAFIKIKIIDDTACLNMLYALEGAIRGMRWHNLEATVKGELKAFFDSVK